MSSAYVTAKSIVSHSCSSNVDSQLTHDGDFCLWLTTQCRSWLSMGVNYYWLQLTATDWLLNCSWSSPAESHRTHDHILLSDGSGSLQSVLTATEVKVKVTLRPTVSSQSVLVSSPFWGPGPDFSYFRFVGKLLLDFASTVTPGFSLLEIHDEDFCSHLDIYVSQTGASIRRRRGRSFYVGATLLLRSISTNISAFSRRPGHYGLCILCHCALLSIIYTRCTEVSCQCRLVQASVTLSLLEK
jgi:hypothetical protein